MSGIRINFGTEAQALLILAKSMKGQGSLEYIMMLAAASLVIAVALAMVVKLKGAAVANVLVNGTSTSISDAISRQLSILAANSV
ncbi:MAG: hypothetical protein KGH53_00835 [Candidatus Micrarchaeota archaeon]|nr:hypothetical protein [Candidatus Micrarchaeota archaeon]